MASVLDNIAKSNVCGRRRLTSRFSRSSERKGRNRLGFIPGRRWLAGLDKCVTLRVTWELSGRLESTRDVSSSGKGDFTLSILKTRTAGDRAIRASFYQKGATSLNRMATVEEDSGLEGKLGGVADVIGNARLLDDLAEEDVENQFRRKSLADWEADERLRRSCEAGTGTSLRVAVLLSGGVDSSVALRLLCNAGHACTAFYLKIWFQEDFANLWSACPWEDDLSFAKNICDEAGVELKIAHLTDEYWQNVVSDSILEIQAGRTPNPDMLCNSRIKFGEFLKQIEDSDFDRVASGHYARVRRFEDGTADQSTQLFLSADEAKDQTYFLSQLSQAQLSRLMFPLGDMTKGEVRELAKLMALPNKQRRDSQGICFLGKVKFSEFVARHLGERDGALVEAETGDLLGVHKGFWFYTIGQRHGIGLSNGPWFVVAKDVIHNVVFISRQYFSAKKRRSFRVGSFNWISGFPPSSLANMRCKVRHGPYFYNCTLTLKQSNAQEISGDGNSGKGNIGLLIGDVTLDRDDQGLAPGQYTAFYQGDKCLGSGIISEALGEDTAVNVSPEALEVAKACGDPEYLKDRKRIRNPGYSTTRLGRGVVKSTAGELSSRGNAERGHENVNGEVLAGQGTGPSGEEKSSIERGRGTPWPLPVFSPVRFFLWLRSRFSD